MLTPWSDISQHLTSDKFLRGIVGRGILGAFFQLVGWTLIGYFGGTDIFTLPATIRRRRSSDNQETSDISHALDLLESAIIKYE